MKIRLRCGNRLAAALVVVLVTALGMSANGTCCAAEGSEHSAYVIGYPDGTMKPLNAITREETAVIFYRLMKDQDRAAFASDQQPFTDVDVKRWSHQGIATLYQAKILKGNPDGSFQPARAVTRAEFAAIAARFERLSAVKKDKFADIENHWAEQYINSSAERGWVKGFGDGTFRPDSTIIRCETMMRVNEALDRRVNAAGLLPDTKQWPDNTADKWYYEIVMEAATTHEYERADRPRSTEKWIRVKENPVWLKSQQPVK